MGGGHKLISSNKRVGSVAKNKDCKTRQLLQVSLFSQPGVTAAAASASASAAAAAVTVVLGLSALSCIFGAAGVQEEN